MRTAAWTLLSCMAIVATAPAQTKVVVPAANATADGNSLEAKPYASNRARLTQLLDRSIVPVPVGRTITEIAYRRDKLAAPTATFVRPTTPAWSVRLANLDYHAPPEQVGRITYPGGQAWNPRNPLGMYLVPSTTRNRLVEVYNQATSFPPLPPVTGPAGPFLVRFKLGRPFVYTGPSGLAIDQYVYEATNRGFAYIVDAARGVIDSGKAAAYGTSCPSGKNRANAVPSNPGGEPFSMLLFDAPAQTAAIAILGGSRTQWGPIPLPWNLVGLGLAGCHVYASLDILLPVSTFTSGSAELRVRIPEDPGLAGLKLFTQWMVVDPRVNPSFPLAFSNGVDVTLGTTVGTTAMPAAFLYGQNIGQAVRGPFGLVDRGITLVTEVTYQ